MGYHDHKEINWPREWDDFRAEYLPEDLRKEQFDDDGLGCFRGLGFALLGEGIVVVACLAVWLGYWIATS